MKPMPTTTARPPRAIASRIRSASAIVRRSKTPGRSIPGIGKRRFRPPVAMSTLSNSRGGGGNRGEGEGGGRADPGNGGPPFRPAGSDEHVVELEAVSAVELQCPL